MDLNSLTDSLIERLLLMPKRITNPKARETSKAKHTERNYDVAAISDDNNKFTLITRQSIMVRENFSCRLLWVPPGGPNIMLVRYNGSDHEHRNPMERSKFQFKYHIHRVTQRYIQFGYKAEMYAEEMTRYTTLPNAIQCLVEDCRIEGYPYPQLTLL